MTARGNPSISPPVQIPQPRQLAPIPGTPPPNQQLFSGQPPPISQAHFEFIPPQQGQSLLSYQAYGSAPNDLRANSAPGGRGGVPQGNLAPAGHYYPTNQNMRPPQPPQNPGQFYMNPQPQGGLRHQRQPTAPNQAILMLPQHNNMVISNMYQPSPRLPTMYPGNASYPTYQNPAAGHMMYFTNNVTRPQHMPMQQPTVAAAAPRQREKRIITISDPNTGRNITDDVLKNPDLADAPQEDSSMSDKGMEIRKNFTRQVAERMKTAGSPPSQGGSMDMNNQSITPQHSQPKHPQSQYNQQQQPQQHPHPPSQPQAPMQGGPTGPSMVRAPMPAPQQPPPMMAGPHGPHMMNQRQGMMQQPMPSQTGPNPQTRMPLSVNLTRPPPQIPNNFYENRNQQNQQPPHRAAAIPSVMAGPPHVVPSQPQTQTHPPQPVPVETSVPKVAPVTDTTPVVEQKPVELSKASQPATNIPSRPSPAVAAAAAAVAAAAQSVPEPVAPKQQKQQVELPPAPAAPPAPPVEVVIPPEPITQEVIVKEQPVEKVGGPKEQPAIAAPTVVAPTQAVSTPAVSTPAPVEAVRTPAPVVSQSQPPPTQQQPPPPPPLSREDSKEGPSFGASTQGSSKDVRKGKRNKKDFNRKDIGGSEMDAFIDAKCEQNGDLIGPSEAKVASAVTESSSGNQKENSQNMDPKKVLLTANGASPGALKVEVDVDDSTSQENSPVDGVRVNDLNGEKSSQVDSKRNKKKKKKNKKGGQAQQPKENKASVQEEKVTSNIPNGAQVNEETPTSQEGSSQRVGGNGLKGEIKRKDSTDGSSGVAQLEPQMSKEDITPQESSVNDVKETSPSSSTESTSVSIPTVAITPPSGPSLAEKQAAKPPTPQKSNVAEKPSPKVIVPEKPAPQKVVAPEKPTPQKVAVSEKTEKEQPDNQKPQLVSEKKEPQLPTKTEECIGNGEPDPSPVEPPVKPLEVKENHKVYNDENEPPKEMNRSAGDNMKSIDESAKDDAGLKAKKAAKDKFQYDRAYLMELRECASSQTKPDGLPDLDIILDRPVSAPRISGSTPLDFTPSFFQPIPGGQRHAPPIGKSSSRGRQRPGDMMPPQRVIKSVSIQNDMKPLHQSEKPWKPSKSTDDGEPKRTLEQEVLFIMNRLTPTNFERLAEEMKKLNINTYEHLTEVVNLFFEKATMETKFVEAYAELCKIMAPFKVPPPPDVKDNQSTFRVVMLTKCQAEFETDKSVIFEDPEEKKRKIEAEQPDTPERTEMIENELYQMKLRRMRFYGNIRFIGELFKLNLLTEKIMHDCIFRLLKARDDDSLLSLCQLLSTVGKDLDTDKAKQRMDQYFTQMSKIAEERKSRIKFTLMDVLDLRSNHWVPRKEAAGPKKLTDVHKDFAQEQARAQFLMSQPPPPRNDSSQQPGSRRGSRQRQDDNKMNDDGWNTVGSKSIRTIDVSKMKISKNPIVDDNIQLGPGGGMNKLPLWARGSHGGQSQEDKSSGPGNRFSALRNDEDRRNFQSRSPSRGDGGPASRGMRQGPTVGHGRGKIISRSSTEGERRDAIASARSILGGGRSQNSSRDNSWNRDDRRTYGPRSSGERDDMSREISLRPNDFRAPAPPVAKKAPDLSRDEMESKAKNILEEYLNIKDLDEAKLCVQELTGQPLIYLLVSSSMSGMLEKHDLARVNTGQYFHELLQSKHISTDTYLKGLADIMEFAEDMIIDIPKLWVCLAQMITPVVLGGSLSLIQVKSAVAVHLLNRNGAILMSNIISIMAEKAGKDRAAKESSALGWDDFLKEDEIDAFLQDRKIDFPSGPPSSSGPSPSPGGGMEQLASDIENLIRTNSSNSELIAYIERTPAVENREKTIVRTLVTAIANSSRSETEQAEKMKEDVIKNRKDVLQKYIGTKIDLQLQALYAVQALMTQLEHPSGVTDRFFNALYEEEVIDPEAFNKWYKSNDPQEQAGKSICLLQLNQFFSFLAQEETSETS